MYSRGCLRPGHSRSFLVNHRVISMNHLADSDVSQVCRRYSALRMLVRRPRCSIYLLHARARHASPEECQGPVFHDPVRHQSTCSSSDLVFAKQHDTCQRDRNYEQAERTHGSERTWCQEDRTALHSTPSHSAADAASDASGGSCYSSNVDAAISTTAICRLSTVPHATATISSQCVRQCANVQCCTTS